MAHGGFTLLENLGLAVAMLCAAYGVSLLYDAASAHGQSEAFRLLGEAVAPAAGLISAVLVTKSKIHWRRMQKQNRQDV